jgi:hypothetical protein
VLEIIKNLTEIHIGVLAFVLAGSFHYLVKLSDNYCVHAIEDLNDISSRLNGAIATLNKGGELRINLL